MAKFGGDISVLVGADTGPLTAGLAKASASMRGFAAESNALNNRIGNFGAAATRAGSAMTRGLTVPIIGIGIAATAMALKFNDKMTQIQTQAGASAAEVKKMSSAVLELAKITPEGPNALADGLYRIESAGIRGAKALGALTAAAHLAEVGHADMEASTYALVAAMKSGIDGAKNLDQAIGTMNATVGQGNMRMNDLTAAFSTGILPMAKQAGISLSEVGAALDVFTNRGKPAQQSATGLTRAFAQMMAPTASAQKALADMGISSEQLAKDLKSGGLIKAVDDLRAHFDVMPNKIRAARDVLDAFGKSKGGAQMLLLVQNAQQLALGLDQVRAHAQTFASDLAATQAEASTQVRTSWSSIQASLVQAGGSLMPVAAQFAGFVSGVISGFSRMSASSQKVVLIGLGIVAALGPAIAIVGRLALAVRAFGLALVFVTSGPLGMFVGVVATVAALVGYKLAAAFFGAKHSVDEFTQALQKAAGVMGQATKGHESLGQATRNLGTANLQIVSTGHQVTLMHQQVAAAVKQYGANSVQARIAVDELNMMIAQHKQALADAKIAAHQWSEANKQALAPLKTLSDTIHGQIDKTQGLAKAEAMADLVTRTHMSSEEAARRGILQTLEALTGHITLQGAVNAVQQKAIGQSQEYAAGMRHLAHESHALATVFMSEHKPAAEAAAMALVKTALAAADLAVKTERIPKSAKIKVEANKDFLDLLALSLGEKLPKAAKDGASKTKTSFESGMKQLGPITTRNVNAAHTAATSKIGLFASAGLAIGSALKNNVIAGLSGLAAAVAGAIAAAIPAGVHTAGQKLHGSGEYGFTKHAIGEPMMQNVAEGITQTTSVVSNALSGGIRSSIVTASMVAQASKVIGSQMAQSIAAGFQQKSQTVNQQIQSTMRAVLVNRAEYQLASSVLGQSAAKAIAAGVLGYQPTLAAQLSQALKGAIDQAMQAAKATVASDMGALTSAFGSMTSDILSALDQASPAAQELAKMRAEDAAKALQTTLDQANAAVVAAQAQLNKDLAAGADPTVLAGDQQALTNAVDQQTQAQRAIVEAGLEDQVKQQHKSLTERLHQLQIELAKHPKEHDKIQKKIIALLNSYGIPYKTVASYLGQSVADGLRDKVNEVGKAAKELADAIKKQLDITVTIKLAVGGSSGTAGLGPGTPHAEGGIVNAVPGGLIRVVEAGHPEAIVPLDPAKRGRALGIMGQVANIMGLAEGGIVQGRLSGKPRFSSEGPDFYDAAYAYYKPYATAGPYFTSLSKNAEKAFRAWVTKKKVPFDVNAGRSDYDMRGYFKSFGGKPSWAGGHFPDTWKTPYDTSFSSQSKYANKKNPFNWSGGTLYDNRNSIAFATNMANGGLVGRIPGFADGGIPIKQKRDIPGHPSASSTFIKTLVDPYLHQFGLKDGTDEMFKYMATRVWHLAPMGNRQWMLTFKYWDDNPELQKPTASWGQGSAGFAGANGGIFSAIASLSQGGIITKDTLAFVHKNEAVIPLSSGGLGTVEVHSHLNVDGHEMAKNVTHHQLKETHFGRSGIPMPAGYSR